MFTLFLVRTLSSCSAFIITSLLISTLFNGQLSGEWLPYIPYNPIGNASIGWVITIFLLGCPSGGSISLVKNIHAVTGLRVTKNNNSVVYYFVLNQHTSSRLQ